MEILVQSDNEQLMQNIQVELEGLITGQGLQDTLQTGDVTPHLFAEVHRGDPVMLYTVLLAAVGAGGALAGAMGKDGFLTELARAFSKYLAGEQVRIMVKEGDKELQMEGSARRIEKMLGEILQHSKHRQD